MNIASHIRTLSAITDSIMRAHPAKEPTMNLDLWNQLTAEEKSILESAARAMGNTITESRVRNMIACREEEPQEAE